MPLAFKRFHGNDDSDTDFLPLIAEVLILSQPAVQMHPNIVNLEGYCWEIKRRTEKAVPVLVFEKAAWDLQQFMNVSEGKNMSMDDRLNLCADIGSAISSLHEYNIIHGDIKPQNVLIFKDATGKTTVKVADFGYSTLAAGEAENICLPKSKPWNAPEHHFGEFTTHNAKLTDVYSFGMLCLWVVSGGVPILQ
ncbi:kinase-like domain-containing protein, partial [Trichophaea hybrida]